MEAEKHVYKQKMEMPKNSIIFDASLLAYSCLFGVLCLRPMPNRFSIFFGLTNLDGL